MRNLCLTAFFILLNAALANAVELTKPNKDTSVPYTKIEIKPTANLFMGAGSITKDIGLKPGDFKDDIKCYFLLSRILLNKLEMGIEGELKYKTFTYAHAFWKTPKFEVQIFTPKTVSNKMFLSPCFENKSGDFDPIAKANQVYTTGHKFLADGTCKEDDKWFIAKKVSVYFRSVKNDDKFDFGFSFAPASHSREPDIKKQNLIKKEDFLKSIKDSFQGSNIVSCMQYYEHKSEKGMSLKICAVQEFGSVKTIDLDTVVLNADGTYNLTNCSYTAPKEAYSLGLSGVLGINKTELKAAVSKTSVKDALRNFCTSCAIEQKFKEDYKVGISYFQSYDSQRKNLMGTDKSLYKSVALYLEKELRKEVTLYAGISGYRGYKVLGESASDKGLGVCFGTKIVI